MEARVASQSQSFRLQQRMAEANISHGQEVRADLSTVRVLALAGAPDGQIFFCNMGPIRVTQILHPGDGRPAPGDVSVEGLEVPASGTYDLLDALVSSNGDIRVVVDEKTRIVPAADPAEAGFAEALRYEAPARAMAD